MGRRACAAPAAEDVRGRGFVIYAQIGDPVLGQRIAVGALVLLDMVPGGSTAEAGALAIVKSGWSGRHAALAAMAIEVRAPRDLQKLSEDIDPVSWIARNSTLTALRVDPLPLPAVDVMRALDGQVLRVQRCPMGGSVLKWAQQTTDRIAHLAAVI